MSSKTGRRASGLPIPTTTTRPPGEVRTRACSSVDEVPTVSMTRARRPCGPGGRPPSPGRASSGTAPRASATASRSGRRSVTYTGPAPRRWHATTAHSPIPPAPSTATGSPGRMPARAVATLLGLPSPARRAPAAGHDREERHAAPAPGAVHALSVGDHLAGGLVAHDEARGPPARHPCEPVHIAPADAGRPHSHQDFLRSRLGDALVHDLDAAGTLVDERFHVSSLLSVRPGAALLPPGGRRRVRGTLPGEAPGSSGPRPTPLPGGPRRPATLRRRWPGPPPTRRAAAS